MITTFLFSLISAAHAQTPNELVKVTAVVQFVEGRSQKIETSGVKTDLVYQTPLYEGDRVETADGALKLATRTSCIFVLRGDGVLAAPIGTKPWRMRAASLRVLCSGRSAPETFGIANEPLSMKNGEVLFTGKKVLLVNGAATFLGKPLEPHKLYAVEGSTLTDVNPQPGDKELRELNLSEKPPREGFNWPEPPRAPEPEKVYTARVLLGGVGGGNGVTFDNGDYNQGGLNSGGARLQVHVKTQADHSLIFALTALGTEKHYESSWGSPPELGPQNSVDIFLAEFGMRNRHDRWWSPYWRIGGGVAKDKLGYQMNVSTGGTSYTRFRYEFYVVSAAYGLDAHLTPHFLRPFGLYAAAEAAVLQSVGRGGRERMETGWSTEEPKEPWRMTLLSGHFSLGLEYDF